MQLNRAWSYAAVISAATLWGFGFVFGKFALGDMPVNAMITYRFLAAAIAVLPILFFRRIEIKKRDFLLFAVAGIFYVPVQFLLQFAGLKMTSLSHAALVVALLPAMIALAAVFLSRGASRPNWIAIIVSAVGAALIVARPGGNASVIGDLLVVVSLVAAVVWVMMSERINQRFDPIASSAWILTIGTIALVAFEVAVHPHELTAHYTRSAWIATIACGIFSTAITTVIWNMGLRNVAASDAGVFINLEPVVGALCGVTLFGDVLTWPAIAGGTFIIAGAIMVARLSHQKETAAARATAACELERMAG